MDGIIGRKLTASQEDYLEAIWTLVRNEGIARVCDIAEHMSVSMPSVTGALKTLAKHGLVDYKPHRYVTLSDCGTALAERVAARHGILRRFLTDILDVRESLAEANACRIEHAVDEDIAQRLGCFVEFLTEDGRLADWARAFRGFCADRRDSEVCAGCRAAGADRATGPMQSEAETLTQIKPGEKVRINRVGGANVAKLLDMGLTRTTEVLLVRVARMGDPIEIEVDGRRLSLSKEDARGIEVEILP